MVIKQTKSRPSTFIMAGDRSINKIKVDAPFVAILFAAVLACWLGRSTGPIDLRWDGGVYYVLGTSLAEGKGYRLLNEPGEIEANQYPPLLPAIIAAHQWVIGTSDHVVVGRWLRMTYFILFNIYLFTVYLIARSKLPSSYALLASLVTLFSLYTYFLSNLCFPEVPFALATTLFVLCSTKDSKRVYAVMAAVFAVAAYALRTAGTALLAAWVCESLLKKEFKKALLRSAVSVVAVVSWMAYIYAVESRQEYRQPAYEYQRADYLFYNVSYNSNIFRLKDPFAPELGEASFRDIAVRFLNNLFAIPTALGETMSTKKSHWEAELAKLNEISPVPISALLLVNLPLFILGWLVLSGVAVQFARRQWLIPLYLLFTIATICVTPWPQQFLRYLAPVTPFLAISLFTLLFKFKESGEVLPARVRLIGPVLVSMVIVVIFLQQVITFYVAQTKWNRRIVYRRPNGENVDYRLLVYFDAYRALDAGLDWLMSQAKPGDVVASSMPHWVYLRTGMKSVMPPFEFNAVEAQRLLDSVPVTYLLVDEGLALDTRRYTSPVVETFREKWKRVYSDSVTTDTGKVIGDGFQIYQRVQN